MSEPSAEQAGSAYGSDARLHAIINGDFTCMAPADAKCRTYPTCECENWCCCEAPGENHDPDEHCCMAATKPGQGCWLAPWADAPGLDESYAECPAPDPLPDGSVHCDWDDGVQWYYADQISLPPGKPGDPS